MHILSPKHQKRNTKPPTNEASAVQSSLLPSAQPVHSSTMKLEVSCPLSCTGQSCHDDHQLRKARAIPIGQHLRCHWNQSAEQNSAHAFPHLAEQKQESFTQVPQRTSSNSHETVLESKRNAEHTQDRPGLCFTCSPEQCTWSGAAAAACSPAPRPAGPSPWVGTWSSWSARPAASRAPHRPAGPGSRRGAAGWGWGSSQLGGK